jgi:WD40 repeat protein
MAVRTLGRVTGRVSDIAFSADGKKVAAATGQQYQNFELRIWEVETGKQLLHITGYKSWAARIAFSPDGKLIAANATTQPKPNSESFMIWNAHTGDEIRAMSGHRRLVRCLAFSPDGKRIVSGSGDKTVRVWDVATGKHLFQLAGHHSETKSVTYSSDGQRIVSASAAGTIHICDAMTGHVYLTLSKGGYGEIALSIDGSCLASASIEGVKLWLWRNQ